VYVLCSTRASSCSLWASLIAAATSWHNASVEASSSRTYKRSGLFKKAPLPDQNLQGACPTDENGPRQPELTGPLALVGLMGRGVGAGPAR
jgi:hypothetical protein